MDIKIIILLFLVLFEMIRNFIMLRKNQVGLRLFSLWFFIWASMLVFLIWPSMIKRIQIMTGFEASGNLLFTGGIIILYLLVHGSWVKTHKLEKQNRILTREIAFLNNRIDRLENPRD